MGLKDYRREGSVGRRKKKWERVRHNRTRERRRGPGTAGGSVESSEMQRFQKQEYDLKLTLDETKWESMRGGINT